MNVLTIPEVGIAEDVGAADSQAHDGKSSSHFAVQRLTKFDVILADAADVGPKSSLLVT